MAPVSPDATTAFKLNDLGALAALVTAQPDGATFRTILGAYSSLGTEDPSNADTYNTVLRSLELYPDMPPIRTAEYMNTVGTAPTDTFGRVFAREVFDWLTTMLSEAAHEDTEVAQDNPFLVASMLSASAIKTQACFSSDQLAYICDGLQMTNSDYLQFVRPEEYEVAAVGALIQVLSAGKRILELEMIDERELRRRLEDIGTVIECSNGERVLEAARELAKNDFKKSWSSKDIWALLDEE